MGNLALEPLDRPEGMTTHEYAHRRLRQAIMVGSIRPGESLTIRGIAEAMESSPTPVREALRRLSAEGALRVLDNRRIMVPRMTADRFSELVSLLRKDELNETYHSLLILAYAKSGQRLAAQRQYARLTEVLKDELGVKPSLDIQSLCKDLRLGPAM